MNLIYQIFTSRDSVYVKILSIHWGYVYSKIPNRNFSINVIVNIANMITWMIALIFLISPGSTPPPKGNTNAAGSYQQTVSPLFHFLLYCRTLRTRYYLIHIALPFGCSN